VPRLRRFRPTRRTREAVRDVVANAAVLGAGFEVAPAAMGVWGMPNLRSRWYAEAGAGHVPLHIERG
jgi:hypothetical protein